MAALTIKEILEQLNKFGIKSEAELDCYLEEYKKYYTSGRRYIEKRTYQRIPVGENVKIACDNKFYTGTVLNISEKGMFIGTKKNFLPNTVICIECEGLKVLVKVKRLTEMNGYYDGVGVEISQSNSSYIEYVNRLRSSPG